MNQNENRYVNLKRIEVYRIAVHLLINLGSIIFRVDGNFPPTLFYCIQKGQHPLY